MHIVTLILCSANYIQRILRPWNHHVLRRDIVSVIKVIEPLEIACANSVDLQHVPGRMREPALPAAVPAFCRYQEN